MMTGGVGNLTGYLLTGGWLAICEYEGVTSWTTFWLGLCSLVVLVTIYFARSEIERNKT
jgi:hypothetical protein